LPLGNRPGRKYPPPHGFTGHGAPDPSGADVQAWLDAGAGERNIGLRLPPGVIGLDVDDYTKGATTKTGGATIAAAEAKWGPLPPTWVSSARAAPSGIRFYRVPIGLDDQPINWPGELGPFVEIIQTGHRYAVVWPSTNPENDDALYEWHIEQGAGADRIRGVYDQPPQCNALPELPESWVRGLALPYGRTAKSDMADGQLSQWLDQLRSGPLCPIVHRVYQQAVDTIAASEASRHETARDAAAAIARLGGEGHVGALAAITRLAEAFNLAIGAERAAGGEWSRLLSGAVKLAATDNPIPRQHCSHDAPPTLAPYAGPPGFDAAAFPQPEATAVQDVAPGALTLPDSFWQARPSLARIRQAAHSRVRSGDVVFYGVLARLAATAPHTLRVDTGIGSPAGLNLFAAVVGPSGGGKSSGISVSRDLIKGGPSLEEFPLGSGEGVAEAYMGEVDEPTGEMSRDGSAKVKRVRKQVRHNALFHADEGNALNKLIERTGSTVGETLRSAWSGETIGQKNGRVETTRTIPAHSYSAGVVIGYQPTTVLPLLADSDAGTPQRFLFVWAVDASIPARGSRVPWPDAVISPFPPDTPTDAPAPGHLFGAPGGRDMTPLTMAEAIRDELYDLEHAKASGTLPAEHRLRDEFRSQHTVLQVKVSGLLALLEGRRNITADDWDLARVVLDTSDAVRGYLQQLAAGKARAARDAAEAAEIAMEGHRAHARHAVAASLSQSADRRLAVRVATWVHEGGEPLTLGALRKRAASRDRPALEAAVELAVDVGWLDAHDGRLHAGVSTPTL
jgi:hypothetical protein